MLGKGAGSLLFNDYKNQTKEYSNYQIKSKDLLNQTLKNKSQSVDYLIEYFEGMILNYISLYEARGKKKDNLKNIILNHNKNNNKIEGGGDEDTSDEDTSDEDTSDEDDSFEDNSDEDNSFENTSDEDNSFEDNSFEDNSFEDTSFEDNSFEDTSDEDTSDEDNSFEDTSDEDTSDEDDSFEDISNEDTSDEDYCDEYNNFNIDYSTYEDDNFIHNTIEYKNIKWNKLSIDIIRAPKYIIIIKHDIDGNDDNNKIHLIINLSDNIIIDIISKTCSYNIYNNTNNINIQLSNIIKRLIFCEYYYINVDVNLYENGYHQYTDNKFETMSKGIISLLIIILTLRNDASKEIYEKYNTAFLLSGICNNSLMIRNSNKNNKSIIELFTGNNQNLLTYACGMFSDIFKFDGDCSLNILTCIKVPEIRELFVDKITLSQNKQNDFPKDSNYYFNKIIDVLDQMSVLEDINDYCELIKNYVKDYYNFTNFIIDRDYEKFIEINDLPKGPNTLQYIQEYYKEYIRVFKNNLLDYNIINEEMNKINDNINNYYMALKKSFEKKDERKVIKKMDILMNYIKKYEKSLNIFYINVLISLLLVKHKINYLFDNNIIDVFKYSEDNKKFVRCFRNVGWNDNELDFYFPKYQKGNSENDKYLFMYSALRDQDHAILSIININKTGEKHIYMYDLNNLIMYGSDNLQLRFYNNNNNSNDYFTYNIRNNISKWNNLNVLNNIGKSYRNNFIKIKFYNIYGIFYDERNNGLIIDKNRDLLKECIKNSLNKINIYYVFENYKLNLFKLLSFNYQDYNYDNFNFHKYIKKELFSDLIECCNSLIHVYNQHNIKNNFLNMYSYFKDFIETKIINNEECDFRNLLFKFIKCLIDSSLIIYFNQLSKEKLIDNLDDKYKKLNIYMDDNYSFENNIEYVKSLNLTDIYFNNEEFIKYIIKILDTIKFNHKKLKFEGGNKINNISFNNSILKKILIILLIIVIIIIIILIVLFIINKYKNNKLKV